MNKLIKIVLCISVLVLDKLKTIKSGALSFNTWRKINKSYINPITNQTLERSPIINSYKQHVLGFKRYLIITCFKHWLKSPL